MSNVLNLYDPLFYANEALISLYKSLGMGGRVHRGYDPTPQQKGSTIEINAPSTFTAQDAPSSSQDLAPASVAIVLNKWKEVKFQLTDKELTFTKEKIIADHIDPAGYALADAVDQELAKLWATVPWYFDWTNTPVVSDITTAWAKMFANKVPMNPAMMHAMVDGTTYGSLMALSAFSQNQGDGPTGIQTQLTGQLGQRFGFNFYPNQNVQAATSATIADVAGAINNGAGYAAGATSIAFDGVSANAAFKAGDIIQVTGHTQQYVFAADVTADGTGAVAAASIFGSPQVQNGGLEAAVVDNQVVTIVLSGTSGATKNQTLFHHRNAFALASAPLSELGAQLGAKIATVNDPVTGLSLRSRIFYIGDSSVVKVALDILFGVKALNPNLALRGRS